MAREKGVVVIKILGITPIVLKIEKQKELFRISINGKIIGNIIGNVTGETSGSGTVVINTNYNQEDTKFGTESNKLGTIQIKNNKNCRILTLFLKTVQKKDRNTVLSTMYLPFLYFR